MKGPPWAPLNAGAFLIILGGIFLVSFLTNVSLWIAFPLIFTVFGIWMIFEAFVIPPANAYAPPKSMILVWGAIIGGLGLIWFVGAAFPSFLPLALVVIVIMAGIAAVGYSFMRAKPNSPQASTS